MRLTVLAVPVFLFSVAFTLAQSFLPGPAEDDVARIGGYSFARGGAPKFLETLLSELL